MVLSDTEARKLSTDIQAYAKEFKKKQLATFTDDELAIAREVTGVIEVDEKDFVNPGTWHTPAGRKRDIRKLSNWLASKARQNAQAGPQGKASPQHSQGETGPQHQTQSPQAGPRQTQSPQAGPRQTQSPQAGSQSKTTQNSQAGPQGKTTQNAQAGPQRKTTQNPQAGPQHTQSPQAGPQGKTTQNAQAGPQPVSYTHLTLPTICSV